MSEPEPPVDIRIHLRDGRTIPVDSYYDGLDDTGPHEWQVLIPAGIRRRDVERITVAKLPYVP